MTSKITTIWVKGLWHQGLVASGVWAERGFKVMAICDSNEEALRLSQSQLPVFEPGLNELISSQVMNGNLIFTPLSASLPTPDVLSFMHDTEVNDDDVVQLGSFLRDVEEFAAFITTDIEIFVTAQVPAGTCNQIQDNLSQLVGFTPRVAYMPENLRLGQAISRFQNPELPVIGISDLSSKKSLEQLFSKDVELKYCTILEAEILKSALNSFLALSITFGNEVSEICDRLDVSGSAVMSLLKLEHRIGQGLPLLPGLPFSGGTLGRDVQNLRELASGKGFVIEAIWESNLRRKEYFLNSVSKIAEGAGEKKIGLLGLTYKTGTSTLRRSFPIQCAQKLDEMGYEIFAYDPMSGSFDEEIDKSVTLCASVQETFLACNVLVITTPWSEIISQLNLDMLLNKTVIDPYGVVPEELIPSCLYHQFGGRRS